MVFLLFPSFLFFVLTQGDMDAAEKINEEVAQLQKEVQRLKNPHADIGLLRESQLRVRPLQFSQVYTPQSISSLTRSESYYSFYHFSLLIPTRPPSLFCLPLCRISFFLFLHVTVLFLLVWFFAVSDDHLPSSWLSIPSRVFITAPLAAASRFFHVSLLVYIAVSSCISLSTLSSIFSFLLCCLTVKMNWIERRALHPQLIPKEVVYVFVTLSILSFFLHALLKLFLGV